MPESGVRNKTKLIEVAVRLVGPPRRGGDTADGSIGTVVVVVVGAGASNVDAVRLASGAYSFTPSTKW
jgi:hypothetical protein